MRCYPEALAHQLKKNLLPLYIVYGAEPFLITESAARIRQQVLSSDPSIEHVVFTLEHSGSTLWHDIAASQHHRSLFSEKQLIEIRLLAKFTQQDVPYLLSLLEKQTPDTTLLIQMGQLTRPQQQAKWFILAQQKGLVVQHWPLTTPSFIKWVNDYAKQQGLPLSPQTVDLLQFYTEGNVLAAKQEIERLALYYADSPPTTDITQLEQQSQFQPQDLCEAILQQQPSRVIKIMQCLQFSGTAPQLLVWTLGQMLRALLRCLCAAEKDHIISLQKSGIRPQMHAHYLQALKNMQPHVLTAWLSRLSDIDKQLKSGKTLFAENPLLQIGLEIAGVSLYLTEI